MGEEHLDVAISIDSLAALYKSQGRYDKAQPLHLKALAMRKRLLGKDHPYVAQSLSNLAALYSSQGQYSEAEPLLVEALAMNKRLLGKDHPYVAQSLNNLAVLYQSQGRWSEAEPLYEQALTLRKRLLSAEHPDVASSLNNLAALYESQGRSSEAEPLLVEALAMNKRLLGDEHPDVASSLNNLAALYESQGRSSEAEPLYEQALAMRKRLLGHEHPDVASSLNNLAMLYSSQGQWSEAEPLFVKVLAMRKRLLGDEHPDVATSLNNLALLYESQGQYSEAESHYFEALAMSKRLLGHEHSDMALKIKNLAALYARINRAVLASDLMQQALKIEDGVLRRLFAASSESTRLTYLKRIRGNFEMFLSLALNWTNHDSDTLQLRSLMRRGGRRLKTRTSSQETHIRAAFDLILRRKALTAAALAAQNRALSSGRYPHLQEPLQQLRRFSDELVQLAFAQPQPEEREEYRRRLAEKDRAYNELQRNLARQIPELQLQERVADCRSVALALPAGHALIEFVRFDVCDFKAPSNSRWQPARYVAFVLPAGQPEAVKLIDLGTAKAIDNLINPFRDAVSSNSARVPSASLLSSTSDLLSPLTQSWDRVARSKSSRLDLYDDDPETSLKYRQYNPETALELSKLLWQPLREHLPDCNHLLLSPDGQLCLVPFQLLPADATGSTLLMDTYTIGYLSAGRDILRSQTETQRPAAEPLILADPDFNLGSSTPENANNVAPLESVTADTLESRTFNGLSFHRTLSTHYLGKTVAQKLGVKPYLDAEATTARLTENLCPRILLIATHGTFFRSREMQDYFNVILELIFCADEETAAIIEKHQKLCDKTLISLMESRADGFPDEYANRSRQLAADIPQLPIYRDEEKRQEIDPMMRSLVALAGANTWFNGGELPANAGKGVLFARDVAALDLWENELTVLSACLTGLGDVEEGEGVFGLRRAFAVAGAKTLVLSLWSVPDRVTALLMSRFFDNLQQGWGRGAALAEAQNYIRTVTIGDLRASELGREILQELFPNVEESTLKNSATDRPLAHPFYWGAWICQGETLAQMALT